MEIEGIKEGKTYYVYSPIRLNVISNLDDPQYLEAVFSSDTKSFTARYYGVGKLFTIEVQNWLQLLFNGFEANFSYSMVGASKTVDNQYLKNISVTFNIHYVGNSETQSINIKGLAGVNSSTNEATSINNYNHVYFKGYPFSLLSNDFTTNLITNGTASNIEGAETRDIEVCNGAYVRWLDSDTNYNYWYFPGYEEQVTTKEIGKKDRWIINRENNTSHVETLGLTAEKEITLSDNISKKYWGLINSIFTSPEIYIHVIGDKWDKIEIQGQNYKNNANKEAEPYSITFDYDKYFTQTV